MFTYYCITTYTKNCHRCGKNKNTCSHTSTNKCSGCSKP